MFDQPGGKIRLYVDGKRAAETSFDAPWQARGAMLVGGSKARGGLSDFWPGAIDAATVYQAALTDHEIERLRDASRPTAIAPVLEPASDVAALEVLRGTWDYPVTDADPKELRQMMADAAAEAGKPGAEVPSGSASTARAGGWASCSTESCGCSMAFPKATGAP